MLLHVGYPRTATSFLQREIFLNHRVGCDIPFSDLHRCNNLVNQLITYPLNFESTETKKILFPLIQTIVNKHLIPVISNEHLCAASGPRSQSAPIIADRLFELFPNAQILITTRNQSDTILSLYKSYCAGGGTEDIAHFMIAHNPRYFIANHLFYHRLIALYVKKFSLRNVLILPYEKLILHPHEYIDTLLRFLSLPTDKKKYINTQRQYRKSSGSITNRLQRYFNPFIAHVPKTLSRSCSHCIDACTPDFFQRQSDKKNIAIINAILHDIYRDDIYNNTTRSIGCTPTAITSPITSHS